MIKQAIVLLLLLTQLLSAAKAQPNDYMNYPVYRGNDLGLTWSDKESVFKVWAPSAAALELRLYRSDNAAEPLRVLPMRKGRQGVWSITVPGNLQGQYYTLRAQHGTQWSLEVTDPYAKAVSLNGKRGAVVDMRSKGELFGWKLHRSVRLAKPTDAVLYELHVRDASIAANSHIVQKGKFLGLVETGTANTAGLSTGLDHIKELGVTHVHLLPSFDYNSVDESQPNRPQYNWGYDPLNYNVPEGSYSNNATHPIVRIHEFKILIASFHQHGLGVVMDVVYNHTALSDESNFNQLVPGYYYRQNSQGGFSNASGCGNEIASERPMVRQFILQSLLYWVKEYRVDGFRFDLMGVHDIATMQLIARELRKIKPDILLYGEGWTAGESPLPPNQRALKAHAAQLNGIAVFGDDLRDGIKGDVRNHRGRGFASGQPDMEESVKFGIVGACQHPQVDYAKVNYSNKPYASAPGQTISYCECHDNHTLWDRLSLSAPAATPQQREAMHRLALSIVLTSQGIAFLHAGTEFLRSKQGVENSYNSPDSINAIDWDQKTAHYEVFEYVKGLVALRRAHPAFRLATAQQVASLIRFQENLPPQLIAYTLNGAAVKDPWRTIFVAFNGSEQPQPIDLPPGNWQWAVKDNAMSHGGAKDRITVGGYGCVVLYRK